ncbi:DUF2797 domain-containing protein [Acinetobacter baumannii]|uniref:DUF2797 domain-containing protein n=1 Tax=Acinetobacter baumannii TaxID=470 RepID=UPI00234C5BA0|nr:DUF2797 domain-containing protein [Acinetobacter baumannii]EKW6893965.1 DUF2797 domain-containing protein [Acinetobacter baumannii]MDC7523024.1 DUF2797 domain-containing protein [Acinetobacter baumannii]MDC7614317.1 DUF2797 domain-containing protein [Acinetobacter baumannii]
MELQGICHKMHAGLKDASVTDQQTTKANVEYKFVLDRSEIDLPFNLGQELEIEWTGNIYCTSCGAKTPKSYSQGHCFKCFKTKAECDLCIMKPETCHYHLGTCREDDFAHSVCFQPHIVYLANSSALKVGITRVSYMPGRWLDQGATQALPILKVGSRRLSGQLETMFGSLIADKTDWRKLLKGEAEPLNLIEQRDQLIEEFAPKIQTIREEFSQNLEFNETVELLENELPREFVYPVEQYPEKIKSLNLDKTPKIRGVLQGIKGQYLIFDIGVINIRKYTGYELIVRA